MSRRFLDSSTEQIDSVLPGWGFERFHREKGATPGKQSRSLGRIVRFWRSMVTPNLSGNHSSDATQGRGWDLGRVIGRMVWLFSGTSRGHNLD